MSIFLVGYMGSGKSTIGKQLADFLSAPFFDLDNLIEQSTGMSIDKIFSTKGEIFFRQQEKSVLTGLNFENKPIIATGGGTPCYLNNMHFMNQLGITLYLKVNSDVLYERLKLDNKRPLLYNNKLHLYNFINKQLLKREKYYKMSTYTIDSDDITLKKVYELATKIR
tara:strand:- start:139 stop:639 length:501 start_codon:yes stop_codon:yes gene_type:complete